MVQNNMVFTIYTTMYAILRLTHVHSTRADVDYLCTYVQVRGTSAMYLVPRTRLSDGSYKVRGTWYALWTSTRGPFLSRGVGVGSLLRVLWTMYLVLCTMYYVLCTM